MTVLAERLAEGPLEDGAEAPAAPARPRKGLVRLVRGRPEDPAWVRPALLTLLASTAVAYLWALGDSGWANSFYAAAVQAGTKSWKAFFFGSSDASNFITVDKPPASLWVMELSARVFGVSSWSLLVPQALEGVAAVGLLYATVRRWFSPGAALIAGTVMAATPVAVLMFRYDNPDALLTLLCVVAAYATVRALERGGTWWLVLATAAVGTGFITKMLQAFLILPAIGIAYLVAAPTPLWRRFRQLLLAGVALVVSAGWWVAAVMLTPAADRPYIGGSSDNNLLNLVFGYNGFGRLSGNEAGSVGGAGPVGSRWGPTGLLRLFQADMGGQVSWLIPGALILLVACLWLGRKAARTDRTRAAMLLFGTWMVVTALVFSYAKGIIHPYYNIALAPPIGGVVGIGTVLLWRRRDRLGSRLVLAAALAATSVWSYVLLARSPDWLPWLRTLVVVAGLAAAVLLVVARWLRMRFALAVLGGVALAVSLAGPVAYSLDTVNTPHSGAIPSAGPSVPGSGGFGAPFGRPGFAGRGGFPGGARAGAPFPFFGGSNRSSGTSNAPGFLPFFGGAGGAQGGPAGFGGGAFPGARSGGRFPFAFGRPGRFGGGGGFLNASTPGKALVGLLEKDAHRYEWVAATVNSNSAAGYQLATDDPVMAIGGFNGTDPAPTLSQFEAYVREGKVHYFIAGGFGSGGGGGGTSASQISQWVESHFKSQVVDGTTLYELQEPVT